jgi:hypothetical protein
MVALISLYIDVYSFMVASVIIYTRAISTEALTIFSVAGLIFRV